METITKYKAIDGLEFESKKQCVEHEILIEKVDKIMSKLEAHPKEDNCDYANGSGFIQQDESTVKKVRLELLKLIKTKIKHKWIQQSIDDDTIHPSYVGRIVHGNAPFSKAWYRFMCIDKDYREWGQGYFALHPNEGKQVKLN